MSITSKRTNEEIVKEIQTGVNVAENMAQLFDQNIGFITRYAKRFAGSLSDENEVQEYVNEAFFALETACRNYRADSGAKFLTAFLYALQAQYRAYQAHNRTVKIPQAVLSICIKCSKLKDQIYKNTGKTPTTDEIIAAAGLDPWAAGCYRDVQKTTNICTIDGTITSKGGEETDLLTYLEDDANIEESAVDRDYLEWLKGIWNIIPQYLTPKEMEVIILCYREGLSAKAIAKRKGVSHQGISETRKRALEKLKAAPEIAAFLSG